MQQLPSSRQLFRREVSEHKADRVFGDVLLPQPRFLSLIVVLVICLVVAIAALLLLGEYSQRSPAVGWLVHEPGEAVVLSPRSGIVGELRVRDGEEVERGAVLMSLQTARRSSGSSGVEDSLLAQLEVERSRLREQIESERILARLAKARIGRDISNAQRTEQELLQLRAVAAERVAVARRNLDRVRGLSAQGMLPRQSADTALGDSLEMQQELEQISVQLSGQRGQRQSLEAEQALLPLQSAQRIAEHEARLSSVESRIVETQADRESVVVAAIRGRVTGILVNSGANVAENQRLLTLVPVESELRARLLIPARAAGQLRTGMDVRLRYDAFPFQKYGQQPATLIDLGQSILPPGEVMGPFRITEPSYLATVALARQSITAYQRSFPLMGGLTLKADIVSDRRSLAEWLLDPLYAAGRLLRH